MQFVRSLLFITTSLIFSTASMAQKMLPTDLVLVMYPDDAAVKGTSVSEIVIEQVTFDTIRSMFVVTGRVGGLEDNRDDSVYMHIDLKRGGKVFTNYYKTSKEGSFTISLLSTDQCKFYGLDAYHAFLWIKQPMLRNKSR